MAITCNYMKSLLLMDMHGQFKYFFGGAIYDMLLPIKKHVKGKSHTTYKRLARNTTEHIRTHPNTTPILISLVTWCNTSYFTQLVANMTRTSSGSRGVSGHPVSGDFCGGMHGCQTAQAVNCSTRILHLLWEQKNLRKGVWKTASH